MTWYQSGSVTVTQGSATITGAGTDFMAPNVFPGDGFVDEAGYTYEVIGAQSSTQLTISPAYRGASGAGRGYKIMPLQDYQRLLAQRAADLIGSFAAVRDGVGQGMFADGSAAAPGIRFTADQDSGLRRVGANALAVVTGGVDRLTVGPDGASVSGAVTVRSTIPVVNPNNGADQAYCSQTFYSPGGFAVARVAAMQSTGTYQDSGQLGLFTGRGGSLVECVRVSDTGSVGIGTVAPSNRLAVRQATDNHNGSDVLYAIGVVDSTNGIRGTIGLDPAGFHIQSFSSKPIILNKLANDVVACSGGGNLLVGTAALLGGDAHVIAKFGSEGSTTLLMDSVGFFYRGSGALGAGVATVVNLVKNSTTGRSINTAGTINASGADYAEYVRKASACGPIAKGDVAGIDRHGELTRTWTDAVRYVVKSTDPNLVGGDTWAAHLGRRPDAPIYTAPVYDGPDAPVAPIAPVSVATAPIDLPERPARAEGEEDEAYLLRLAAYLNDRTAAITAAEQAVEAQAAFAAAQARYDIDLRQYRIDQAAYDQAQDAHHAAVVAAEAAHAAALEQHAEALTAWEAELEAARQTVDRIAFSGQVPVNVDTDTLAACEAALGDGVAVYLVAVARGAGIGVTAVREADMTLQHYMRRLGVVWAIRDGRPWIDVQHG